MLKPAALIGFLMMVLCLSAAVVGQQTPATPTSSQGTVTVESAADQALTYIDTAAKYLGQGVLYLLNMITGDRVSAGLEKTIGYLALITLILILFGLLDVARRVIWIGIIIGWVLLIVRIVLDALKL